MQRRLLGNSMVDSRGREINQYDWLDNVTLGYSLPRRQVLLIGENFLIVRTYTTLYESEPVEDKRFLMAESEVLNGWIAISIQPYNGPRHGVSNKEVA